MFYQKEVSQVFKECQSNQNGLTDQEVEQRHQQFGYNVLDGKDFISYYFNYCRYYFRC